MVQSFEPKSLPPQCTYCYFGKVTRLRETHFSHLQSGNKHCTYLKVVVRVCVMCVECLA